MVVRVRYTHRARVDLRDITIYLLENASRRVAERTVQRILRKVEGLRTFPRAARVRPELGGERRIAVVGPYLVIYNVWLEGDDDTIVILHVVHGARDLSQLMAED